MIEIVCNVYWEKAESFEEGKKPGRKGRVLYALFGTHPLYGRDVLLYIGKTEADDGIRMNQHAWWISEELEDMTVKFASIKNLGDVETWRHSTNPESRYEKCSDTKLIDEIESLLIYAHQPAFNSSKKVTLNIRKGLRIFNSGKRGLLYPELSWAYFDEASEP